MNAPAAISKSVRVRRLVTLVLLVLIPLLTLTYIDDPLLARAALLGGLSLALWLTEVTPPFVPTLLLLAGAPLLLEPLGREYRLSQVLAWAADPVLALFLGGFTLSVAASRYGIDARVAYFVARSSQGSRRRLLIFMTGGTALLSMWMSNIAAAAMMLAAVRPLLATLPLRDPFRRALLLGIAFGADFGGMATPIGSGPNAIAIAASRPYFTITFIHWMSFALPLTLGMLAATVLLLMVQFRVSGRFPHADIPRPPLNPNVGWVVVIFGATVVAWLTEPLHHTSSAVVALASTTLLFGTGLLDREALQRIDWPTLLLIAGGLTLGALLDRTGLITAVAAQVDWHSFPPLARLLALVSACALLSALMSNTGAATLLIPLAMKLEPSASIAVVMAIGASFGIPFTISTPPNAMAYGEGGLKSSDLLWPGLLLMILGCVLVSITGTSFLKGLGIP